MNCFGHRAGTFYLDNHLYLKCFKRFFFSFLAPAIFLFRLDIDECTTNVHNCDPSAVCSNTVGYFHCACIAGYKGNGTTCVGERCFYVQVPQVGVACRSLWQCTDRFKEESFL